MGLGSENEIFIAAPARLERSLAEKETPCQGGKHSPSLSNQMLATVGTGGINKELLPLWLDVGAIATRARKELCFDRNDTSS